jgi:UDP-N-acetylglucosamine--N-acetylmuramyl-(pentapeptide) pyrophosphoryl-undecaprenol N-acetylglucosamine transferase
MFYVIFGIFESYFLLKRYKPDVIFLKGGYVGLPVGISARFLKIPYVTHDSDAMASLTNSIVGKTATYNLTGSDVGRYKYDKKKTIQVGTPVSPNYYYITEEDKDKFKQELGIPITSRLLLIIGGSLGSREVNKAFANIIDELLIEHKNIHVIHQVGKGNLGIYKDKNFAGRLKAVEFLHDLYKYSGAADIVITRAGANTLAELSIQGKTLIIIPNHLLTGGHQLKNANELRDSNAAIVITESEIKKDPKILYRNVARLLKDNKLSADLSNNITKKAFSDSSRKIAEILVKLK